MKNTRLNDRFGLKYSFDIFNITNTPSFDIPIDDVTQNEYFDGFPDISETPTAASFYNAPFGLGNVNKTIGSARQMQMSLKLTF